jgi:hypothetical protein
MTRRQIREISLWLAIFTITAIFQFWRASELDGLIFIVIIALLAISAFSNREFTTFGGEPKFRKWGALYLGAIAITLVISRIHTLPAMVALLAAVPLLLISREKYEHIQRPKKAMVRSSLIWSGIAVAAAVWELVSYILGAVTGNDERTPTISMLVDPILHHPEGRFFFVLIWTLIGYELLFVRKSR